MPNTSFVYKEIPKGEPIPGQTTKKEIDEQFDPETVALKGGVLLKAKAFSLDPYMRGRMRDPAIGSYSSAYEPNKPVQGFAVGEVVRSEHTNTPVGTVLYGFFNFSEYVVFSPEYIARLEVVKNEEKLAWTTLVGAAGMSGRTAYWSFYNIGKPKKGETIFISAASGAVGQIVGQLAKREGLKVVGSAGGAEKVKFLKELGFDVAFDYKSQSTEEILRENPPDIYFDNVGGEVLDLALQYIQTHGRIIACGAISQYNLPADKKYRVLNYMNVVTKQLTYQGFIITGKDLGNFHKEMPKWIASGDIKIKEHITKGIDDGEAFVDMLSGRSFGKAAISME